MAFDDTIERTWRENILFSALVELTYRCNLDCFFCYNDTALKGAPLSLAQYFRFFDDLRELGTLNLTLSGGEPLAHPEFFALGAKARELGFVVRIKSNGHALRGRILERVRDEIDPFIVEISLHGATAATHDRQTRVPGSFERLVANVRAAKALGLRMRLNGPLTTWNAHEIEAMFALTDALQVDFQFDSLITRRDDGDPAPLAIAPPPEAVARLYAIQRERAAARRAASPATVEAERRPEATAPESGKQCGAGSSSITIDPFGNVYPCVQWRRRIGSLHEHSIRELWRHSTELDAVRGLAIAAKQAVDRHATRGFAFCPGTAEQETGSPAGLYPAAKVMLDMRKRVPLDVRGATPSVPPAER